MDLSRPENAGALAYLARRHPGAVPLAPPESVADPYYQLGSHPDIVERLWVNLNQALPHDCRQIVYGTPALVQPETGSLLALALGTQYNLQLPKGLAERAVRAGAQILTRWAGAATLDVRQEFGESWVFGRFLAGEPDWLNQAYRFFASLNQTGAEE